MKLVLNIYPRWQRCVSNSNAAFGYANSSLYIQDYFDKESKSKVGNTVQTSSIFTKYSACRVFKKNVFEIISLLIYKSPIPFTAKKNTCKFMLSNPCYCPVYHVYIN